MAPYILSFDEHSEIFVELESQGTSTQNRVEEMDKRLWQTCFNTNLNFSQDDISIALSQDNASKSYSNASNNPLFVSHYSEESKGPRCEKSSKTRRRHRQDDEFIDAFALDKPHMKVTQSEATDSFSGEIQNPVKQIMNPRKQYMTKRRREAALLTSTFSQALATFPQTSFEGLFEDMPTSDSLDTSLVTSVNKSNAVESAKNTTDTTSYGVAVASDIKSDEKSNVAVNYPKPLKKLLHSSVVPSNKSSVPPRATVLGQQTRKEVIHHILTANNTFHNYPLSNGTSFLHNNYMSAISNETGTHPMRIVIPPIQFLLQRYP